MTGEIRICVLGNSHLAAAKTGWDRISARFPGAAPVFFGAPRNMMQDLVLEGRHLVAKEDRLRRKLQKSSGGHETVALGEYDAFILYGLQFGPRRVIQLYRTHRPMSFEWREALAELTPMEQRTGDVQTVSERLFDRAALSGLRQTTAMQQIAQIRTVSKRPVHLVAAPGFNESVLDTGDWDGPLGAGDLVRLATRYRQLAEKACPPDVALHLPPEDALAHALFTARRHGCAAKADGRVDHVHTGADYGADMLARVLERIGAEAEGPAGALKAAS